MATRDDLMRLLDGELTAAEATRVRAQLSPEDRERLAAMEEVGSTLRKHLGERADAAKLDTWSAIAGKLDDRGGEVVRPKRWVRPHRGRRRCAGRCSGRALLLLAAGAARTLHREPRFRRGERPHLPAARDEHHGDLADHERGNRMKAFIAAALLVVLPQIARGQARCELREVEGTRAPGGIGSGLEDVKGMLSAPPFSEYKTFHLMGTHPLALKKGQPEKVVFSHKHRYEVTFLDRLAIREGHARLRLKFEIFKPDGKNELSSIVVVDENGAPLSRVEQNADRITVALLACKS
jgi:hypothetical protein